MEATLVVGLFLALLILLVVRMPIGFAMMFIGFVGYTILLGWDVALRIMPRMLFDQSARYGFIILPLFIISGACVLRAGLARSAFEFAQRCFGHLRGGMALATVGACAMFGACTGSSIVTSLTVGRISIPEMKRHGVSDALATGTIAAAGTLGMLIPPSAMLVLYGLLTDLSIIKLFIAGLIPGIVSAAIYMVGIHIYARINPAATGDTVRRFSWTERLKSAHQTWGIFALFVTIVGGIYTGIFTVTEAAGAGAVVAFAMLMTKRERWANTRGSFYEAARTTAALFFMLLGAIVFSNFIRMSGVAVELSEAILAWPLGPTGTLIVILLIFVPLGMIMDPLSMMLLTMPVVLPAVMALGHDPIWFGIILIKMCELANITPPIGLHAFVIKGIAPPGVQIESIFKGCSMFVVLDALTIALLVAYPEIALWLPSTMD